MSPSPQSQETVRCSSTAMQHIVVHTRRTSTDSSAACTRASRDGMLPAMADAEQVSGQSLCSTPLPPLLVSAGHLGEAASSVAPCGECGEPFEP